MIRHISQFDRKNDVKVQGCFLVLDQEVIFALGGQPLSNQKNQLTDNYLLRPFFETKECGEKFLLFEHTILPQLNYPRKNCAAFVHRDFLFVLFGEQLGQFKVGSPFHQIEFASVKDLFAFEHNPERLFEVREGRIPTPWQCLTLDTPVRFFAPAIIQDFTQSDTFLIFGGSVQAGKQTRHSAKNVDRDNMVWSLCLDF